jgi:hypothetical protein
MNRFKEWCRKERVDRPEKGTSQDMCPTNGDALFFKFIMSVIGTLLVLALYFKGI